MPFAMLPIVALVAITSAAPPTPRTACVAGAVDHRIVLCAGTATEGDRRQVVATEILDTRTGTWTRGADMPTARDFPAAATVGGRVMVLGGMSDDRTSLGVVETYHVGGDRWSRQPEMPSARNRAGACAIGGRVYVAGGVAEVRGAEASNTPALERWDPTTATWERLADMRTARHGHCVVAYKGEVWVIGGYTSEGMTESVEIFDPGTGAWREGPALPETRGFASAAVVGDRIVVMNSRSDAAMTSVVYEDGAWREGPSVPDDRHRGGVAVVGDSVYLVTGSVTRPAGEHPHTLRLGTKDWRWHAVVPAAPED